MSIEPQSQSAIQTKQQQNVYPISNTSTPPLYSTYSQQAYQQPQYQQAYQQAQYQQAYQQAQYQQAQYQQAQYQQAQYQQAQYQQAQYQQYAIASPQILNHQRVQPANTNVGMAVVGGLFAGIVAADILDDITDP